MKKVSDNTDVATGLAAVPAITAVNSRTSSIGKPQTVADALRWRIGMCDCATMDHRCDVCREDLELLRAEQPSIAAHGPTAGGSKRSYSRQCPHGKVAAALESFAQHQSEAMAQERPAQWAKDAAGEGK